MYVPSCSPLWHKQTFKSERLPLPSSFPSWQKIKYTTKGTKNHRCYQHARRPDDTFSFNPGQPHHLISMYKRTSEYKRASKYKRHERLKDFMCHPRKVTWQLSCRVHRLCLLGLHQQQRDLCDVFDPWVVDWEFIRRRRWKKWARSPENLRAEILTKEKNTISGMKICSAQIAGGILLRRGKTLLHIWS